MKKFRVILFITIMTVCSSYKSISTDYINLQSSNSRQSSLKDYAYYVGYFYYTSEGFPSISGTVNVYTEEVRTGNSEVLTGKLIVGGVPHAFTATGFYYYEINGIVVESVDNFDGYVTVNGTQYHIQYTGGLTYP